IAFLTTQTNLANLQASQSQHMSLAIGPRLERRDEKLNAQLVPLYDPTGRLFLASEDPVPVDQNLLVQQQIADLKYGVGSINGLRSERGLPPVLKPIPGACPRFAPNGTGPVPGRGAGGVCRHGRYTLASPNEASLRSRAGGARR